MAGHDATLAGHDATLAGHDATLAGHGAVGARHQRGDHSGQVLVALAQCGIPSLFDVDGAAQRAPGAGPHPLGDLVPAQASGQRLVPSEDEGQSRVATHGTTVPAYVALAAVVHRPVCARPRPRPPLAPAFTQFRPLAGANSPPGTGLN